MKKLKVQVNTVSKSLAKLSKQVDKITKQLDKLKAPKAAPAKKAVAKKKAPVRKAVAKKKAPAKKAVAKKKAPAKKVEAKEKATVLDTVFGAIKKARKGITVAALQEKTKLNPRQLSNALYKLSNKGMIAAKSRGLYVKK
jgi:predicted Rossmann fold nucleotide-binding protein DprA/Smf involved in DNA uptake